MAEPLEEFFNGKNMYELVMDFHMKFKHEYNDTDEWIRLSAQQRVPRGKWMAEEIMEYVSAAESDQIEQVDALVDLLYFTLGTFVMIGFDPYNDARLQDHVGYGAKLARELHEVGAGPPPADRLYMGSPMNWRARSAMDAIELVFDFVNSPELKYDSMPHGAVDTERGQLWFLRRIMDWTYKEAAIVGADLHPYFRIAHNANMAKLWPDGAPRFTGDGKIRKPETWVSPKQDMVNHMLVELHDEGEDDDIPF